MTMEAKLCNLLFFSQRPRKLVVSFKDQNAEGPQCRSAVQCGGLRTRTAGAVVGARPVHTEGRRSVPDLVHAGGQRPGPDLVHAGARWLVPDLVHAGGAGCLTSLLLALLRPHRLGWRPQTLEGPSASLSPAVHMLVSSWDPPEGAKNNV